MTVMTVPWWRRLTPTHLILVVPWIGVAIAAAKPVRDNSFLWHVRAGTLQLDVGHVLATDPFSFTMQGGAWRTQSWLVELGYGLLERWTGGLGWVRLELVVVVSLTYALLGFMVYRRGRNLLATGVLMVAFTWLAVAFEVPRPVVFSGLLLALLVVMLDRDMLWPVPLLLWVWAAIHGSWILGLGFIVLHWLAFRRPIARGARTLGVSLMTITMTAHGLGVWSILIAFFEHRDALAFIQEWAIPNVLSIQLLPYVAILVLFLMAAIDRRLDSLALWIVVPFFVFGLSAGRSLYPAMIVLLPYAATGWPEWWRWRPTISTSREAAFNLALGGLLLAVPLGLVVTSPDGLDTERFPVAASGYLASGPAWSSDGTGGYLIYAAWPDRQVFIDDRAELYGARFMEEFAKTREGSPVWKSVFRKHGIRQALVAVDDGLARALVEAGWQVRYREANRWEVLAAR